MKDSLDKREFDGFRSENLINQKVSFCTLKSHLLQCER